MRENDPLDRLLDSALATYADPALDAGLEKRVLEALTIERRTGEIRSAPASSRRWLPWVIAVPLAASLLLSIGTERFRHAPSSQQQQASQSRPSPSLHDSHPEKSQSTSDAAARPRLKGHDFSRAVKAR